MTYLDSFGLGVLVGVYLSTRQPDCRLRFVNVNQQAKDVLRITNLTYLVEVTCREQVSQPKELH